jgi:hypothetical protein
VKSDWDAWNTRSLAGDPIVRLILDGTVVRVRLDRGDRGPSQGLHPQMEAQASCCRR